MEHKERKDFVFVFPSKRDHIHCEGTSGVVVLGRFDSDEHRMSVLWHTCSAKLKVLVVIYIKLFSAEDQPDSCKSLDIGCFC